MMVAVLLLLGALAAGVAYWLLILTEGVYLGPRVVRILYDREAKNYDRIKEFDMEEEAWHLGIPLERRLRGWELPGVLDVATGTGRMLLALLRRPDFDGWLVGLDASLPMLQEAKRKMVGYGDRVHLIWKDASSLPFADGSFAAVTCIEGLEFLPHQRAALGEMARVLAPGGVLLLSNRVGRDALFFPRRAFGREGLKSTLLSLSLTEVNFNPWQPCFDLVWARKEGEAKEERKGLLDVLVCPRCGGSPLVWNREGVGCIICGHNYPLEYGVLNFEKREAEEWQISCPLRK